MKSDRRHELQTNYLADQLGTAASTGKPYATWLVGGLIAAAVLALAYGLYSSQVANSNSQAWGDYYFNIGSGDAEVFQQVAKDHPQTSAASWSEQAWADNQLMVGLDQIYNNRSEAEKSIQAAIGAYEKILSTAYEPELQNRAAMGLGQALESIGKLDEAARHYKQVAGSGASAFATMAANRLAWISSGDGKAFYEWFATVRKAPAEPPAFPSDLSKPPTTPGIAFPPIDAATLPTTPATSPSGESKPAAAGDVPLPAAPSGAVPAVADPSTSETKASDAKTSDANPGTPPLPVVPSGSGAAAPAPAVPTPEPPK